MVRLPPAPRGIPQIEVTFDIDANGILNVAAKDKATGKEQKIIIQASSGLSEDEINQMIKDAEAHVAEDKAKRELVDLRNQADQLAYQTEKQLEEYKEKIPSGDLDGIRKTLEELKEAAKTDDAVRIKAAVDSHNTVWQNAAKVMYEQASAGDQQATDQEQQAPTGEQEDGKVVDAEYEVIDEEEKK